MVVVVVVVVIVMLLLLSFAKKLLHATLQTRPRCGFENDLSVRVTNFRHGHHGGFVPSHDNTIGMVVVVAFVVIVRQFV